MVEKRFLPRADYCPDSDFCIKMGGCMSGCTGGPATEESDIFQKKQPTSKEIVPLVLLQPQRIKKTPV